MCDNVSPWPNGYYYMYNNISIASFIRFHDRVFKDKYNHMVFLFSCFRFTCYAEFKISKIFNSECH